MALHMHTSAAGAGKLACSRRHSCRPSQLPCKQNRRLVVVASSGQRPKSATSAVATTEAPTQQQQQQLEQRIASVSVNLGTAVEQVTVPLSDPDSRLVQAEISFPLGLVIERVNDEAVVTEVSAGSAAEAAGCRVGDVVRATSAMTMQMVYPTMNIMFGGVGRPALVKILVPTAKAPFSKVLDAVRSNSTAQGGDGSITLVLERCDGARPAGAAAAANSSSSSSSSDQFVVSEAGAGVAADGDETAPAFDPKIFE